MIWGGYFGQALVAKDAAYLMGAFLDLARSCRRVWMGENG
jgi:hypothetical protein